MPADLNNFDDICPWCKAPSNKPCNRMLAKEKPLKCWRFVTPIGEDEDE